jgi:hypothetical protein
MLNAIGSGINQIIDSIPLCTKKFEVFKDYLLNKKPRGSSRGSLLN